MTRRVIVFPLRLTVGLLLLTVGLAALLRRLRVRSRHRYAERLERTRQEAYEQARRELSPVSGSSPQPPNERGRD